MKRVLVGFHFLNCKNNYEHKKVKELIASVPTNLITKHDIADYVSREINGMLHNSDSNLILRVNYIEDYLAEQK